MMGASGPGGLGLDSSELLSLLEPTRLRLFRRPKRKRKKRRRRRPQGEATSTPHQQRTALGVGQSFFWDGLGIYARGCCLESFEYKHHKTSQHQANPKL